MDRQKQNLMRLYRKELVSEPDLEKQLAEVGGQQRGAEQRRAALVSQRDAAVAMKKAAWDIGQRLEALAARLETATVEQRRELVAAVFPRRAPYGLKLFPDGRIEALGALPLPPPERPK